MAKKIKYGKRFEEDFVKSIPDRCDVTRLKDGGGWNRGADTRFTISNPCDFIVWNGLSAMYKLELKSVQGTSLPFSNIKEGQLDSLWQSAYKSVNALFIVNFRGVNETYAVTAIAMTAHINTCGRKSLSLENAKLIGKPIAQTLIRVRWRYDLNWL